MILIISLESNNAEFTKGGYSLPTALIKALGKPIVFWLVENLIKCRPDDLETVLIAFPEDYLPYRLEDLLRKKFPTVPLAFICLRHSTRGALDTVSQALNYFVDVRDQPVVFLESSSHFYSCNVLSKWNRSNQICTFREESGCTE